MKTNHPEKKIALFGGTFDPIHNGHLDVARFAAQRLAVDRLLFIPAKRSPLKPDGPLADDTHRFNMIQRALQQDAALAVTDCELNRPAPSYTLDTLNEIKRQFALDTQFFWLIGADAASDLHRWYRIDELLEVCTVVTMVRAEFPAPDYDRFADRWPAHRIQTLNDHILQTPKIPISSSKIRAHLAAGKSVDGWVPESVLSYIREHHLYQDDSIG